MNDSENGEWLGTLQGITVRKPAEDAEGPILEIHGSEGMAAVEVTDTEFADGFSQTGAELQSVLEGWA